MIELRALAQAWLEGLGATTLHASALVIVVLLVQAMVGQRLAPRWRSALWWLVIARLALPVVPGAPWSMMNLLGGIETSELGPSGANGASPGLAFPIMLGSWALGAFMFVVFIMQRTRTHRRLLNEAAPLGGASTRRLFDECRSRMGVRTPVTLWRCGHVSSPMLAGMIRPRLILPADAASLGDRTLRDVFLHELAHVRRRDIAASWLVTALLVLHWFNPLLWLAAWRVRVDRECACDALALSSMDHAERFDYGESLLALLSRMVNARRPRDRCRGRCRARWAWANRSVT